MLKLLYKVARISLSTESESLQKLFGIKLVEKFDEEEINSIIDNQCELNG